MQNTFLDELKKLILRKAKRVCLHKEADFSAEQQLYDCLMEIDLQIFPSSISDEIKNKIRQLLANSKNMQQDKEVIIACFKFYTTQKSHDAFKEIPFKYDDVKAYLNKIGFNDFQVAVMLEIIDGNLDVVYAEIEKIITKNKHSDACLKGF